MPQAFVTDDPTRTLMTYGAASEIDFTARDCRSVPRPGRVLMTMPTHFRVEYVINPHMTGQIGKVDGQEAGRQWRTLRDTYESLGFTVNLMEGREELADMVFCANQTLPYYRADSGKRGVVLSRMHAQQRRDEVPHFEKFFREIGYEITMLPGDRVQDFEGMGDAIWHPRRYLLWGGHGIRTSRAAYDALSEALGVRVVTLLLEDDDFYHLDTCFCPLDPDSVLIFPGAFGSEDLETIYKLFDRVLEAPEHEARRLFACNAHCPDGEHVLIQKGCDETSALLHEAGFSIMEVDTGEFMKAGGSVFCMKQMFW